MKELSIKELIKDNFVYFSFLRQGFAYYNIQVKNGKTTLSYDFSEGDFPQGRDVTLTDTYQFCIPLDDIGNGTLRSTMKAIECMRWIRKALENKELIKQNDSSRKTEAVA